METIAAHETLATSSSPNALRSDDWGTSHLRWGAILGGAVASLAVASMLYALGIALGLSWLEPGDAGNLRPAGTFSAVWLLAVSVIALFVGGYVAARGAGDSTRRFGALQGLVVWGVSVVASAWMLGNVASAVIHGGAAFARDGGRGAMGAMGPGAQRGDQRGDQSALGVGANDEPNQRLRNPANPDAANAAQQHRLSAEDARDASRKASWVLFGSLLLGMLAAIGGAVVGADRDQRSALRQVSPTRRTTNDAQHAEVFP